MSVELKSLTPPSLLQWRGQGRLQRLGIGLAGRLVRRRLGLQALQFLVAELHTDQLRFGVVRERVGVVVNVVDFDGGHGSVVK
jgi:hypothetical protein